jgi:hypothetical protein
VGHCFTDGARPQEQEAAGDPTQVRSSAVAVSTGGRASSELEAMAATSLPSRRRNGPDLHSRRTGRQMAALPPR